MKLMRPICSLYLIFLWCSCQQAGNNKTAQASNNTLQRFPEADTLDHLKETVFVPTLESPLPAGKTAIYAPTVLLSWDHLRKALPDGILLPSAASGELKLLNGSSSFRDALGNGEYEVTVRTNGGLLFARSTFSKSLPYGIPFDSLVNVLQFNSKPVRAYGLLRYDYAMLRNFSINRYKDADHFVVTLQPADSTQEIILAKGLPHVSNLWEGVKVVNTWLAEGKTEERCYFESMDELAIPVLKFNLFTHYTTLEHQSIVSGSTAFLLEEVSQRIALVMDEKGAETESEGMVSAAIDSVSAQKKLYFDKPFLVVMRKKTTTTPYLVMLVNNTELMVK